MGWGWIGSRYTTWVCELLVSARGADAMGPGSAPDDWLGVFGGEEHGFEGLSARVFDRLDSQGNHVHFDKDFVFHGHPYSRMGLWGFHSC